MSKVWIQTATGRRFDPFRPSPASICVDDIVCGLSNVCRYAGQVRQYYSVAEHSCLVASLLPRPIRIHGLLHDAAEAYIGDVPRTIKKSPPYEFYSAMESDVLRAVYDALHVPMPDEETVAKVKRCDDLVLREEVYAIKLPTIGSWGEWLVGERHPDLQATIFCLPPREAAAFYGYHLRRELDAIVDGARDGQTVEGI